MTPNEELKRQIEISSTCVIQEAKRLYLEILSISHRRDRDFDVEDKKWTEAVESLPNTKKICSMNIIVVEIMIDVIKRARWNCWIDGRLLK